jgi:hypothetical protein
LVEALSEPGAKSGLVLFFQFEYNLEIHLGCVNQI